MKLAQRIKEAAAAGYVLLALGIPIPILLMSFSAPNHFGARLAR